MDTVEWHHVIERGDLRCVTRMYRTGLGDRVFVHAVFRGERFTHERITISGPPEGQLRRASRRDGGGKNWPGGQR